MTAPLVWSLPPVPETVGEVRNRLRTHLRIVPEPRLDDVLLVASEVLTNAIRHGKGPLVVQVWQGPDVVRVEVVDHGPAEAVHPRERGEGEEGGWGLHIVQALATRWGVAPMGQGPGKRVWFEVDTQTG
jgi:anti-sigma regulatory factor (Ser/Thr protein kinase)